MAFGCWRFKPSAVQYPAGAPASKVFELSGITAVLLDDVENTPQPPETVEIKPISAHEAEAVVSRIYNELTSE